jgi:PAS domain S-box-containing protein
MRADQELAGVLTRLDTLAAGYREQARERRARQEAALARTTLMIDVLGGALLLLLLGVGLLQLRTTTLKAERQRQALGEAQAQLAAQASGREADQRAGDERRRLVFSRLQIGTWEFGLDDHVLHSSREALDVVGEAGFLALVCAQDRERVRQAFAAAKEGEGAYAAEFRVDWPDGQRRWIATQAAVLRDGSGRPLRLVGIHQDVTARKLAEDQIREHTTKLEEEVAARTEMLRLANQELEAFTYSVSHDLRAPLRAIDGFSAALMEDHAGRLDQAGLDQLTRVRRAAQRMAELIDDLLARVSPHAPPVSV